MFYHNNNNYKKMQLLFMWMAREFSCFNILWFLWAHCIWTCHYCVGVNKKNPLLPKIKVGISDVATMLSKNCGVLVVSIVEEDKRTVTGGQTVEVSGAEWFVWVCRLSAVWDCLKCRYGHTEMEWQAKFQTRVQQPISELHMLTRKALYVYLHNFCAWISIFEA